MATFETAPIDVMHARTRTSTFPYADVLAAALEVAGKSAKIVRGDDGEGWPTPTANGYVRGLQERHGPAFLQANNLASEYVVKAGVMATDDKARKVVKVALVPKMTD
jgi:hypothetical protein